MKAAIGCSTFNLALGYVKGHCKSHYLGVLRISVTSAATIRDFRKDLRFCVLDSGSSQALEVEGFLFGIQAVAECLGGSGRSSPYLCSLN